VRYVYTLAPASRRQQIVAQIREEAAEPRQAASVKQALEEKTPAAVSDGTLAGSIGGKTRAAKPIREA